MDTRVFYSEDPAWVLAEARVFLRSEPVLHNLILTLLQARAETPQPGRYWVATRGGEAAGVVFQSPVDFTATITPMAFEVVAAMVDAIVDAGAELPGVSGAAATAAQFAGQWTERRKSAAVPVQGLRIYEVDAVQKPAGANGRLRQAGMEDFDLIMEWMRGFQDAIGEERDPAPSVSIRLPAGQCWLWEDGEPVSIAMHTKPVEGVERIGAVYTPPEKRNHGYAAACVAELSEMVRRRGNRCILYTDLGNPSSNAIYRRIGYRAVAENLLYKFGR